MAHGFNQYNKMNRNEVVGALRPYLVLGYSVNKACEMASIPHSTVATWLSERTPEAEELRLKIGAWQGQVSATARKNIIEKIYGKEAKDGEEAEKPDLDLSKWWLERKDKDEFRSTSDIDEASVSIIASLLQKAYDESNKQADDKVAGS